MIEYSKISPLNWHERNYNETASDITRGETFIKDRKILSMPPELSLKKAECAVQMNSSLMKLYIHTHY